MSSSSRTRKRKEPATEATAAAAASAADVGSSTGTSSAGASGWLTWLFGRSQKKSSPTSAAATIGDEAVDALPRGALPPTYVEGFHDEEAVRAMTYWRLGQTGLVVSVLSLGASSLGGVFRGDVDDDEAIDIVVRAIRQGINLIDTAPWYGQGRSERILGRALAHVPRKSYYLATKVGRYELDAEGMFDFRAERVTRSVHESLERLGLDYIDVIQAHDIEYAPTKAIILHETLPALHKLREAGLVRQVGITGYPLAVLRQVLEESPVPIDTCLSYCHHTLNDATLASQLLPFLKAKGVGLINASPVSMGLLTKRGPPSWHPAHAYQKDACREAVAYCEAQGVDITKLALWFSLFSDARVPTTLVSTASTSNLQANLAVARAGPQQLSSKEQQVLSHLRGHVFSKLQGKEAWEGVEVNAYWTAIGKRAVLRDTYKMSETAAAAAAAADAAPAGPPPANREKRQKRQRV